MKYCLAFLLTTLLALQSQAQIPQQGLEAYFSFDDCALIDTTAIIASDFGNVNITNTGDVKCDPTDCGINGGNSLVFDGNANQLNFLNTPSNIFSVTNFSMSFYLKPGFSTSINNIFSKRDLGCDDFHVFSIDYNPGSNVLTATLSEDTGINGTVRMALDPGRCWQHVVLVREGATSRLFLNGSLRDEKQAPKIIDLTNSAGLTVASMICEERYAGSLDELVIYRRALSQRDVDALFVNPDQIANRDTTIFIGNSVDIGLTSTCAEDFVWSPAAGVSDINAGTPALSPTVTTTYRLNLAEANCEAVDSVRITVLDPDELDCSIVYLPKAFTPNNDGLNDGFGISNPNAIDDLLSFEIFDRWGSRVFSTDNPFEAWDGTFDGQEINPGVLLYRVRHVCRGEELVAVGSLSVIR